MKQPTVPSVSVNIGAGKPVNQVQTPALGGMVIKNYTPVPE